jgi:hypothetical protein
MSVFGAGFCLGGLCGTLRRGTNFSVGWNPVDTKYDSCAPLSDIFAATGRLWNPITELGEGRSLTCRTSKVSLILGRLDHWHR